VSKIKDIKLSVEAELEMVEGGREVKYGLIKRLF
jgi:hypothetical protein